MSSNTFCRHLSNGYRLVVDNNQITWRPCCYWTGNPMPFNAIEIFRKKINNSTPWIHKECSKCKDEEQYKGGGYRLAGLDVIPDGLADNKVAWLDIQADITCNGGCLTCGPWSSSYWQSELSKYKEFELKSIRVNLADHVDQIFDLLDTSELRLIQFLGGEPFLSDTDTFALPKIVNPKICEIKYTTNGSVYPQAGRMAQWNKFKSVLINFSIDGIGPRFEYQRYPLKWNKVEDNVKRLIAETGSNVKFHINHTVTPFNIYYYQEFLDWVANTFPTDRFTGIHTHPAYGVLSVSNCSDKLRKLVLDKYGEDHITYKMLQDNPVVDATKFWEYIATWDNRRNQDWKTVYPDIVEFMPG
jgi:hypothetical protein